MLRIMAMDLRDTHADPVEERGCLHIQIVFLIHPSVAHQDDRRSAGRDNTEIVTVRTALSDRLQHQTRIGGKA